MAKRKPKRFPREWYSEVFEALGHERIDYTLRNDLILMQRIKSVFRSGFTVAELLSVLHLMPKNVSKWRSNLHPLLAQARNEKEKQGYLGQSVRIGGMESVAQILERQ